jgi:hypothetical protein
VFPIPLLLLLLVRWCLIPKSHRNPVNIPYNIVVELFLSAGEMLVREKATRGESETIEFGSSDDGVNEFGREPGKCH